MKATVLKALIVTGLLSSCGTPLKQHSGSQSAGGSVGQGSQDYQSIWSGWDPEVVVADNGGSTITSTGPESARTVGVGQNYNMDLSSPFGTTQGLKYEIVLFPGSALINNSSCSALQSGAFLGDIKACLNFTQPTTVAAPILVIFTGPFGTKTKLINFRVEMKPAPVLVLKSTKPIVSTHHIYVDQEDLIPLINTQGEFRIKAVYDGQEILNPSVVPSADITREGEDFVIKTNTPGKYTFSANWRNANGTFSQVQKEALINSEKRYQAGESGQHGVSSNGGSVQCYNSTAQPYTIVVKTDEATGAFTHNLVVQPNTNNTTPKIYRKSSDSALKYLFFTVEVPWDLDYTGICRIRYQSGGADLE